MAQREPPFASDEAGLDPGDCARGDDAANELKFCETGRCAGGAFSSTSILAICGDAQAVVMLTAPS
jgi:hypothetical protein